MTLHSVAFWKSKKSELFLNPRMPLEEQRLLSERVKKEKSLYSHIWLATSGTTSTFKLIALSKEALLTSAQAVNTHLNISKKDTWLNPLPQFHVGGLSIWARAYLSQSQVVEYTQKWDPVTYYQIMIAEKISLSSLVPTQVFDLVKHQLKAPATVRAILVGGGRLDDGVYQAAIALGWPLLPSYGMTECCSQIATATFHSPALTILPHVKIKLDEASRICVQSPSLLTYSLSEGGLIDPKVEGWLTTQDCGIISGNTLQILGRIDDFIKVGGELVSLPRLEDIFNQLQLDADSCVETTLVAFPDERLGHQIHLTATSDVENLVKDFNKRVLPFEQVRKIHYIPSLPRSPLGKILRKELMALLLRS